MTMFETHPGDYGEFLNILDSIADSEYPDYEYEGWWDGVDFHGDYQVVQHVVSKALHPGLRQLCMAIEEIGGGFAFIPYVGSDSEELIDFQVVDEELGDVADLEFDVSEPIGEPASWNEALGTLFFAPRGCGLSSEFLGELLLTILDHHPEAFDFLGIALNEDPLVTFFGVEGEAPDALLDAWFSGVPIGDILG